MHEIIVSFTHHSSARARDGRMRASNAAKVAFVSGNDGATFGEVNAIVFVVFAAACVSRNARVVVVTHDDGVDVALGFVLAYAGLAAMFAPELARSVAGVAFAGCLATWSWSLARRWRDASTRPSHVETSVLREGVTTYRFVLTTLTITAILAIDFDLFPRRLGKTETYGLSLMDIGGGSYVFSSGFVSSLAASAKKTREEENFKSEEDSSHSWLWASRVWRRRPPWGITPWRASTVGIGIFLHAGARQTARFGGTARPRRLDGNGDRGDVSVRSLGERRRARRVDFTGSARESASAGSSPRAVVSLRESRGNF